MLCSFSFHWIPFGAEPGWVSGHHLDYWTWWQWACWGMCFGHQCFGVFAHWALPSTVHGGFLWKTQSDFEGHGAHLAFCPPASWGAWCRNLIRGSYKLCWMGQKSCLPRKITPDEPNPGSLVGYSTSWGETWDLGSESKCPEDGPEASDDVNKEVQKPWPLLNCLWEKPSSSVRVPKMQENIKGCYTSF